MSNKKALIAGINVYRSSANNLPSCVNDSNKFSELLSNSYGFNLSDIHKIQDTDATLTNIQEGLKWLFQDAKAGDQLVFYYSGHGHRTRKDGLLKECLVPSDEQFFFDDELSPLTQSLPSGILSVILDSCYSGGMEKAFFVVKSDEEPIRIKTWFPPPEELSKSIAAEANSNLNYQPFGRSVIRSNLSFNMLAASSSFKGLTSQPIGGQLNGLLMSACKADEVATASTEQTEGLSAFTFGLLQSIESLGTKISNKILLDASRQKVQNIGLKQTPLLIEPLQPQGISDLSFITFEPADKSIVDPSQPEASSGQSDEKTSKKDDC
jgi:Caspase domain